MPASPVVTPRPCLWNPVWNGQASQQASANRIVEPALVTVPTVDKPTVRVAYVIPSNRAAQTNAVRNLQNALVLHREWYRQQMTIYGFGPKTFHHETEGDGVTPKIHVVPVTATDAHLRNDIWANTIQAAIDAGVPVWASGQIWLLVPEAHQQLADGRIEGGTALGASFGSGSDPGVAMIGSDALARFDPALFQNENFYNGWTLPSIGPYQLVKGTTFPDIEKDSFSSVASSVMGAAAHELGHAFGLAHSFCNDLNFHGNLMGHGLRGFRNYIYPYRYYTDHVQLGWAEALALNVNRYFNAATNYTDNTTPTVSIATSGAVGITNGLIRIHFSASDAGGLSAAILATDDFLGPNNTSILDGMSLNSNSTNASFALPYYAAGASNRFSITVYDKAGNRAGANTVIVPASVSNRAPLPFLSVMTHQLTVGGYVWMSVQNSSDPDNSLEPMQVEWDLNGDGTFDTPKLPNLNLETNWNSPGVYKVTARVSDSSNASAVSIPIPIKVYIPQDSLNLSLVTTNGGAILSWPAEASDYVLEKTWDLLSIGAWYVVPTAPAVNGTNRTINTSLNDERSFYRLIQR